MPDKSAEKFARVVDMGEKGFIVQGNIGNEVGLFYSGVTREFAEMKADEINAAHEKAVQEARNGAIEEMKEHLDPVERYWFHECGRRDLQIAALIRKNGELERELKTLKGEKP